MCTVHHIRDVVPAPVELRPQRQQWSELVTHERGVPLFGKSNGIAHELVVPVTRFRPCTRSGVLVHMTGVSHETPAPSRRLVEESAVTIVHIPSAPTVRTNVASGKRTH